MAQRITVSGTINSRPTQTLGSEFVEAQLSTDDGRNLKIATRKPDLGRLLGSLVGQHATFQLAEQIKDRDGRTYRNYYFEGIDTASRPNGDSGIDIVPPAAQNASREYEHPNLRAWRIALAAGAHLAVDTMPLMPNEQRSFDTQKQIALAWALWIFNEGRKTPDDPEPPLAAGADHYDDPGREAPIAGDEDIPF